MKVQYLDEPDGGMEEWLPFRHFVVAWKERKHFLSEEAQLERVKQRSNDAFDRVTADAIQFDLDSTGEAGCWVHGHLSMPKDEVERTLSRAGCSASIEDLGGFVQREGEAQIPFDGAERLARAFSAAKPNTVTLAAESEERVFTARGYDPGESYWHNELRKRRPVHASPDSGAGFQTETLRLQTEIERLRSLLSMGIRDLRRAGDARSASQLERLVDGR